MLESQWRRVEQGQAAEQEIVDTVCLAGKLGDKGSVERIVALLACEHSEVRYYALSALVLDMNCGDDGIAQHCWRMLQHDSSEHVRSMAATCLGSIYAKSKRRDIFQALKAVIASPGEQLLVKGSAYHALFSVLGRPPIEWPLLKSHNPLTEDDIDWDRLGALEAETVDP